jgi:hypothetical protein
MQIATPFRWLVALVLWLGPLLAAHATHILGGDISYKSIASTTAGVPRYHVTAILYRDPSNVQQPTLQVVFSRNGCGSAATTGSFALVLPRNQTNALYSLGCTTLFYSYEVYLYETDVDLPAGQWTISATEYNRAASIQNLTNSVATSFYITTYLDNTLAAQNASPRFLSTLLPYLCNGQAQRYSFSAFDSDGDSLVYQFRQPEQSTQTALPPASPYSCGVPIAGTLSPHFQLNTTTGALTANPAAVQQGRFAMAARVSEYRRINGSWQQIGYVTRDITYLAYGSLNQTPRFTALRLNGATTTQPLSQTIRVPPGQAVALALEAADPDAGQALRFESQAPGIIPGLSLQTTGATSAQLTWQVPATLPPGRYTATVAVLDNGCPNASEEYTFSFLVSATALAMRAAAAATDVYPIPFREQVQFTTAPGQAVLVVDALGREVARLVSGPGGLVRWQPAASLPAGLYLARAAESGQPLARLLRAD